MINNIKKLAKEYEEDTISFRRELHENPEPSMEEIRTTKRVAEELTKYGIPHRVLDPVGVIADIKGGKSGKTIALRGDMDALSMIDLKDVSYKSKIDGMTHGCGHDAHTSMLLSAAKILNEVKEDIQGNIRLIFQPAEETAAGAKFMIENNCMDNVDNVFGIHVRSSSPTGVIGISPGKSHASADFFFMDFKGKGGHGAHPHLCIDAVMMASLFVTEIQTIVSRKISPMDPAVVTIGQLTSGTRFNIIAEEAHLEGTVRCFNKDLQLQIKDEITKYANNIADTFGGSVDIDYVFGTLPVINEEKSAQLAQKVVMENFGEDYLMPTIPGMGGEDFSYYQEYANGCFATLGTGNKEKLTDYSHHHGLFDVDEDALIKGVKLYCLYALYYLNQDEF